MYLRVFGYNGRSEGFFFKMRTCIHANILDLRHHEFRSADTIAFLQPHFCGMVASVGTYGFRPFEQDTHRATLRDVESTYSADILTRRWPLHTIGLQRYLFGCFHSLCTSPSRTFCTNSLAQHSFGILFLVQQSQIPYRASLWCIVSRVGSFCFSVCCL